MPFEKSRFYSAFQAEYPGRVGLDIFPFIPPLACVNDPAHLGLSLCAKGARDTVVAFAVRLESQDGTGVTRLLSALRLASLPAVRGQCKNLIEFLQLNNST